MSRSKIVWQTGVCSDCGRKDVELNSTYGICNTCLTRKRNMINRGKVYVPYVNLSQKEKERIDKFIAAHASKSSVNNNAIKDTYVIEKESTHTIEEKWDMEQFVNILKDCGSEMPTEELRVLLELLTFVDKLKTILSTITESDRQQNLLDLEQTLNVAERKLQHDWEYNEFNNEYDILFKNFLRIRRQLKRDIFFWKKLYQTGTIVELKKQLGYYDSNPMDRILTGNEQVVSTLKRYQITTVSISTIFNTHRPFTRIFYAQDEEDARKQLTAWFDSRQLHEDKSKTVVTLLA